MLFDALTTICVREALRAAWLGARVQRAGLLGERAVALELYAGGPRRWLVVSADPTHPHVRLAESAPPRDERVTPLLLLLRKYVRDARLVAVEQPPWERVLLLSFRGWDEEQGERTVQLSVELVGRHANVVLIGPDGAVLDALRRVGPEQSRQRRILPHARYALPPPQPKPPPTEVDAASLAHAVAAGPPERPLWQVLVAAARGVSPLLAREVAYRGAGDANALAGAVTDWPRVANALAALVADALAGRWAPCVAREGQSVVAFAPYELTQHAARAPVATIWEALDAYYGAERKAEGRRESALQGAAALRTAIAERLERARRRTEALRRALAEAARADALRQAGELLLAYASEVHPGQTALDVGGRTIALDPQRSAVEQAQDLFREYRKARGAQAEVPERLAASERDGEYWAQLLAHVETARTPAELRALRAELGWGEQPQRGPVRRRTGLGGRVRSAEGFEILVGRSARHNEEVTFERADADDLWLHARGVPGAHVVVRSGGRAVPPATLDEAAAYAAHYSQSRSAAAVEVDYTARRYVKRIPSGPPGLVRYSHERTIRVQPRPLPSER
ncbi:MAG: NFACT family protein [Chloroflexi bacterium]|nr:NFACT family protein [Chloroflexota bacterium]